MPWGGGRARMPQRRTPQVQGGINPDTALGPAPLWLGVAPLMRPARLARPASKRTDGKRPKPCKEDSLLPQGAASTPRKCVRRRRKCTPSRRDGGLRAERRGARPSFGLHGSAPLCQKQAQVHAERPGQRLCLRAPLKQKKLPALTPWALTAIFSIVNIENFSGG